MCILITGTPGTGKTTIARRVAQSLGKDYLDLADLVKKHRLYIRYDEETDSFIVDLNRTQKHLDALLTCNEIIDTHLVEAVPPEKISKAIVLRLDPMILFERLKAREYSERKIKENVEAEILDYVLISALNRFGENKVFEVDTTGKNIGEVVEIITRIILKNGKIFRPGSVNWLEKYYFLIEK